MPRKLDSFPEQPQRRYDWNTLLDGQPWELMKGEDFDSKPSTIRANAQLQARKRGGRVRTRHLKDNGRESVVLQFVRDGSQ